MAVLRTPTDLEREALVHLAPGYDPAKAHEYYLRTRELKGRKSNPFDISTAFTPLKQEPEPERPARDRAQQKKELQGQIQSLSKKLPKLDALIREKERRAASENLKSKARKERAAKREKPKTAAKKAEAARELKHKAKQDTSVSGGDKQGIHELKALATRVRGQIAVAKQKLAAL